MHNGLSPSYLSSLVAPLISSVSRYNLRNSHCSVSHICVLQLFSSCSHQGMQRFIWWGQELTIIEQIQI